MTSNSTYNRNEIITKESLLQILKAQFGKEHWYEDYVLDELSKVFKGFTIEDVDNIINGAKKKMIIAQSNGYFNLKYFENTKQTIQEIIEKKDLDLYRRINKINEELSKSFNSREDKKGLIKTMSELWKIISRADKKINQGIYDFTEDSLSIFEGLAAIYSSLIQYLGVSKSSDQMRESDNAVIRIAEKLQSFTLKKFDKIQIKNVQEFLEIAVNENNPSDFTKQEMITLISSTPSILGTITKEKYQDISKILTKHIILAESVYKVKINKQAKNVILNAGTILQTKTKDLEFSSNMLLGVSIGQALKGYASSDRKSKLVDESISILSQIYKDVKIQGVDINTNNYMFEHPTFWSYLKPSSLYARINSITKSVCLGLGVDESVLISHKKRFDFLKEQGFDVNTMLTKDNLIPLCDRTLLLDRKRNTETQTYDVKNTDLTENIKILSKIIPASEIHKILSHNIVFLLQDPEELKNKIKKLAQKTKDIGKFKDEINKFVNQAIEIKEATSSVSKIKTNVSKRVSRPEKQTEDLEREKIKIDAFVFDSDYLTELGLIKNDQVEIDKNKLLKEIQDELFEINDFVDKKDKGNNSKIISKLKQILDNKPNNAFVGIELLSLVADLERKIKYYISIASDDEKMELLNFMSYVQTNLKEGVIKQNTEIDLDKEVIKDGYTKTTRNRNNLSEKKIEETLKFLKRNRDCITALGTVIPKDIEVVAKTKKQAIADENLNFKKERQELEYYQNDLISNTIVKKVYQKLNVVLTKNLSEDNSLIKKTGTKHIRDEILAKLATVDTEIKKIITELAGMHRSIENKIKTIEKYTRKGSNLKKGTVNFINEVQREIEYLQEKIRIKNKQLEEKNKEKDELESQL